MKNDTGFLHSKIDLSKVRIYEDFIKECAQANVQLYIVCPPLFVKPNYVNNSVVLGKEIADKYNVKFLDYSKDISILSNPRLFADISHLNSQGATVFSHKTVDQILAGRNAISQGQRSATKAELENATFAQRNKNTGE
jgi:hypothetical protein